MRALFIYWAVYFGMGSDRFIFTDFYAVGSPGIRFVSLVKSMDVKDGRFFFFGALTAFSIVCFLTFGSVIFRVSAHVWAHRNETANVKDPYNIHEMTYYRIIRPQYRNP